MPVQPRAMAMHQANYLPWLGYFFKMARVDVFVYLDAVQYPRGRTFAARNEIKTPQGRAQLTVPVSRSGSHDGKTFYREVVFADHKWPAKHLKALELNYRKSTYFDEVFPLLRKHIIGATTLVELNLSIIEEVAEYLQIASQRVRMSELGSDFGNKTQLIVDLCKATDASVYLSGTGGGHEYNDEEMLKRNGIELRYSDFTYPRYPQLWGPFEPRLSIVDALFNLGRDTRRLIELPV